MTEKTLTTENIKPALDALRGELAPWPVVAKKQDRLNTAQLNAANSGITSSLVAQIIANTAAIRALESAITGTGLRALVVSSLPAIGTQGILYIVPVTTYDPETDADVVNYSNEYIWIPVEGGTASEGHYEQVGQTGVVINNGQLTITVNGTSVGTFTANQSGDTTAAITVPTNADYVDLTTDQTVAGVKTFSSTITGTASKAIADEDGTSIKTGYVNVAGNQTVSGQKTFSANIHFTSGLYQRNTTYEIGTTPASNINIAQFLADKDSKYTGCLRNAISTTGLTSVELEARNKVGSGALSPTGNATSSTFKVEVQPDGSKTLYFDGSIRNSVLPYATNTYSLGSSSYQWSSVYAQSYYYNGTAWGLDKVNEWSETNVFTKAYSDATYSAIFGFSNLISVHTSPLAVFFDVRGSSNYASYGAGLWAGYVSTGSVRYGHLKFVRTTDKRSETNSGTILDTNFSFIDMAFHYSMINFMESVRITNDGTENSLKPITNNATDLGTSTNKWKTLNGINPGALSLPNSPGGSGTVNINYIDLSGDITIRDASSANFYTAICDGWIAINSYATWIQIADDTTLVCVTGAIGADGFGQCYLPVRKNDSIRIVINQTNTNFQSFKLIPCQGNV